MISGHRRKIASELAYKKKIPCIIRDLSDNEAVVIMVDSNLQREHILPSEKAFAYKMKLEAMKMQRTANVILLFVMKADLPRVKKYRMAFTLYIRQRAGTEEKRLLILTYIYLKTARYISTLLTMLNLQAK